jgi:uncharacterized membrane protein YoaK (UPF0700 family)
MVLVCAMAIQNAVHRIHLASAPPTTLMTGTTTQIMIDLVDIVANTPVEQKETARTRMSRMITSVAGFALGCGAAALLYARANVWCFAIPPLLALAAMFIRLDLPAPKPGPA